MRSSERPLVFLSYRRDDSKHLAGRIADRVASVVGPDNVFMDVEAIKPGANYTEAILDAIAGCDVFVAIIGPTWASMTDGAGRLRIEDSQDLVVREIGFALGRDILIVPVLVDGAQMPSAGSLPVQVRDLAYRQSIRVDHETFRADVAQLVDLVSQRVATGGGNRRVRRDVIAAPTPDTRAGLTQGDPRGDSRADQKEAGRRTSTATGFPPSTKLGPLVLSVIAAVLVLAVGMLTVVNWPRDIPVAESKGVADTCGAFRIAINPWVGYEATAHVLGNVATSKLGCDVEYKNVREEVAWQGMGNGEVDVVVENWGHPDLKQKYITEQKTAQEGGSTGNVGVIGWYVPPWMATQYPDITDWNNLNKYAEMFKTTESGGKGQLLDGDPSFVTNDEALVKNLNLNYQVVYAGSEAALIQAFRQAETNKTPLIGYFYDPQWFMSEVPLVKVNLPPYTDGCDADAEKIACDYPKYDLDKIVATKFAEANGPAYKLVKAFTWTNEDQNAVAKYIAEDGMDPEAAAAKWIGENQPKVDAWLAAQP